MEFHCSNFSPLFCKYMHVYVDFHCHLYVQSSRQTTIRILQGGFPLETTIHNHRESIGILWFCSHWSWSRTWWSVHYKCIMYVWHIWHGMSYRSGGLPPLTMNYSSERKVQWSSTCRNHSHGVHVRLNGGLPHKNITIDCPAHLVTSCFTTHFNYGW